MQNTGTEKARAGEEFNGLILAPTVWYKIFAAVAVVLFLE